MALFDTGTGLSNLFEGMNIFGARPSEALTGIITSDQQEKLKNQALLQGLLGAGATYLAQPKNQGIGLGAILGKSYLGGMQQSQGAYDTALKNKIDTYSLAKTIKQTEMEGLTPLEKWMKRREDLAAIKPDDKSYENAQNQIKILDQAISKESGGLSGFGSGVEGTSLGILARGSLDTPEALALRKTPQYALAYREATSPKTIMQETMDANGNVYTVPVKINQSPLPGNILPPEGVQIKTTDVTKPQITTQLGQVNQQIATPTQAPVVKKQAQTKQDIFKQEQDIRKDYISTPEVKNFGEVRSAYNIIDTALKSKSPAGDLAAATKFMKILDPSSVVRETELAMAMNATGLTDKAQNYFSLLASGQKLTPQQREDFRNVATNLFKAAESVKTKYDTQYADIAKSNNLDPAKIIMGYKESQQPQNIQPQDRSAIFQKYGVKP